MANPSAKKVEQAAPAQKSSGKKWLFIIGGCLIFLVLIVAAVIGVVVYFVNAVAAEPIKVSDQFLEYMEDGRADLAYDMTSSTFQAATTEEQFQLFVDQVETVDFTEAELTSKEVNTETDTGTLAQLSYDVVQDGPDYTVDVELSKDGDEWLINYLTVNPK